MNTRTLTLGFALLAMGFCLLLSVHAMFGEGEKAPPVDKAVHWASGDATIDVYLYEKANGKYGLDVITPVPLTVKYHTSQNTILPVVQELTPLPSSNRTVQRFEFQHNFSRTTIWMGLEFTYDGKCLDSLTRTFRGDITKVAPKEDYWRTK